MKKRLLLLTLVLIGLAQVHAQAPSWVTQRPISEEEYIGIGIASLSDDDHMKIATQNALSDISSQIATKIENSSFLHTVDVDGRSRQMFEDKIVSSMAAWLEGMELKDSYKSSDKYYVLYTLDKELYRKNSEKRQREAISKGLDFLNKGRAAEDGMNLVQAMQLYGKGLEAVEPWLFMDLSTRVNGMTVNVPAELYDSYINVFSGMAITTNVTNIEGEAFKPVKTSIAACLSKNGIVLPNVKLKAEFTTGSGAVTPTIETDYDGTAEFYITNITSKDKVQEIRISIDDSFVSSLPKSYRELLNSNTWPSAKVTVTLAQSATTAYIYLNEQNDLEGIERNIGPVLANNYFSITEDPDAAECFIDLSTIMEMGEMVTSGRYNLNTCYCTLILKIYNNQTQQLLLDYTVNRVKVLAPENKTAEETIAMCIREVMKRVKQDLPKKIKKMNL